MTDVTRCKDCPRPARYGRRCKVCAASHAQRERERRAARKRAGQCPGCGGRGRPGYVYCADCIDRAAEGVSRRRAK